jgi:hypothetical protein
MPPVSITQVPYEQMQVPPTGVSIAFSPTWFYTMNWYGVITLGVFGFLAVRAMKGR